MSRFGRFPKEIRVPIPTDGSGMVGRSCPRRDCKGYFKLKPGTGLKGRSLLCLCPYCGHKAKGDAFWTKAQREYAKAYALRAFNDLVFRELKKMEFNHRPRGAFGIGISMTVKQGPKPPLRYYRERALETEVVCDQCTLRYSVFGVFGFCPDCGCHNSRQILDKNLDLAVKVIELAENAPSPDLKENLIQNALEDVVSSFDGFGRELLRAHAARATDPEKAAGVSFQSLAGADRSLQTLFGASLQSLTTPDEWKQMVRGFHKRHVIAHKGGVIDEKYVEQSGDETAIERRKVRVTADEVRALVAAVRKLGEGLWRYFTPAARPAEVPQ